MRRQVTSPFVEQQQQQQQQRVMSPGPANPIALQLRGSQANLQQALRMHEDITRQVNDFIIDFVFEEFMRRN